ncbi:hypothetical protein C8R46DRAFT_1262685 [Mycena filopes]|nr:hypothetical protein C8R46DRAFT_1262685 [Mycena filopes]
MQNENYYMSQKKLSNLTAQIQYHLNILTWTDGVVESNKDVQDETAQKPTNPGRTFNSITTEIAAHLETLDAAGQDPGLVQRTTNALQTLLEQTHREPMPIKRMVKQLMSKPRRTRSAEKVLNQVWDEYLLETKPLEEADRAQRAARTHSGPRNQPSTAHGGHGTSLDFAFFLNDCNPSPASIYRQPYSASAGLWSTRVKFSIYSPRIVTYVIQRKQPGLPSDSTFRAVQRSSWPTARATVSVGNWAKRKECLTCFPDSTSNIRFPHPLRSRLMFSAALSKQCSRVPTTLERSSQDPSFMLPHLLLSMLPQPWVGETQGAFLTRQGATVAAEVHTIAAAGQREVARATSRPPLGSAMQDNRVSAPWGGGDSTIRPKQGAPEWQQNGVTCTIGDDSVQGRVIWRRNRSEFWQVAPEQPASFPRCVS